MSILLSIAIALLFGESPDSLSAASQLFCGREGYTEVSLGVHGGDVPQPLLPENGKGGLESALRITTLVRTDTLSAVSGGVVYNNGMRKSVIWNSSSDYELIYPYVVADSVGGDLLREQYRFWGGYARRSGDFHYGFKGSYRALHEWRTTDPRPRNIVSDLEVSAAAGKRFIRSYILDISASYRRYSQSQDMNFYNPRGANSSLFHLSGLGSHYARFAGNNSSTIYTRYEGNGAALSLSLIPVKTSSWHFGARYSVLDIIHYLPSQNETPYQESVSRELLLRAFRKAGSWTCGIYGSAEYRTGIEYVLDNGSGGLLQDLTRFAMFGLARFDVGAAAKKSFGRWYLSPSASIKGLSAVHYYPGRDFSASGAHVSLEGGASLRAGKWSLSPKANAGAFVSFGGSMFLPGTYTEPSLMEYYNARLERFTKSVVSGGAALRADRPLKGMRAGAFVEAGASGNSLQAFYYQLIIGLIF